MNSIQRLFVVGVVLLLMSLIFVVALGHTCNGSSSACASSGDVRMINTFFPYPMIAGGLLIGYGMKKLADSHEESNSDEPQTEPDKKGS